MIRNQFLTPFMGSLGWKLLRLCFRIDHDIPTHNYICISFPTFLSLSPRFNICTQPILSCAIQVCVLACTPRCSKNADKNITRPVNPLCSSRRKFVRLSEHRMVVHTIFFLSSSFHTY
jgi:hypothetical protein